MTEVSRDLHYTSVPMQGFRFGSAWRGAESFFVVESKMPLRTLNSSMWGEGFGRSRRLMNRQVSKHYHAENPLLEMNGFLSANGIPTEGTAALMTAADLRDYGFECRTLEHGTVVCAWVTAGLSNKARAGMERDPVALFSGAGTINIIVAIEAELTDAAFVNTVITATEAKTAALQDLNIRLEGSDRTATGTTTDAVLIAATQRGTSYRYAGTATVLGHAVGRTVYEATKHSAERYLHRN